MRIATGHERPSAGRARVLGEDVGALDARGLARLRRHGIAVVDQRSGRALLPELSAIDNVALRLGLLGEGRRARRARGGAARQGRPRGAWRAARPAALSGGQAQRVAVCAAVAHAPGAIVADEPTGELDAETADVVLALLGELAQATGAGLLVVSHDLRAAAHADRLLRIRDGRLSEERAPADGPERQVVDARGWLRLPAELRDGAGLAARGRGPRRTRGASC